MTKHLAAARVEELLSKLEVRRYARELVVATLITGIEANHSDVQDMYTRLLPANLDFDSELQHVFCWAPGECRDSRVFYFDLFSPSLLNVVLASGFGVSNVTRGLVVLTSTHVFPGHGMFSSGSC